MIHSLPLPSAILFDWDDTLIQTWPFLWQLYQRTFTYVEKDITDFFDETSCKDYAVRYGRQTFNQLFGDDLGEKARNFFVTTYQDEASHALVPLEGAKDALMLLKQQNIPMAVVSNKESTFLKPEITRMGFAPFFKSIVARDIAGAKPSPNPAYYALKELSFDIFSIDLANVWFIGDTTVDAETAHAVGCTFIGFGAFFMDQDVPSLTQEHKSVANWNQFHSLLSEIHLKYT